MDWKLKPVGSESPESGTRFLGFAMQWLRKALAVSGLFLLGVSGCSHVQPYFGPDISREVQEPIRDDQVVTRVVLIGDAGAPKRLDANLQMARRWVERIPGRTVVLFLGDNIYPNGMPAEGTAGRVEAEWRLMQQVDVVKGTPARAVFVPGNHDWRQGGQKTVARQQAFVNRELPGEANLLPKDGCPGPATVDLPGVRLIVLDTEWWLRRDSLSTAHCAQKSKDEVVAALGRLVATAGERRVVLVGHHPFAAHGPHGGFYTWKEHLFPLTNLASWAWLPLPVIGSIYPLSRWYLMKHPQDLSGTLNREMVRRIGDAVAGDLPLVYASGHDHSLEVMQGGPGAEYLLVSGSGSKVTGVSHGDNTLFAHSHKGFMVLDFVDDGRVLLRVVEPGELQVALALWLR